MSYCALLTKITAQYTREELESVCKVLNKGYNVYDPENVRWRKIQYALFRSFKSDIEAIRCFVTSNKMINDLFLHYYICERVVKYYLIKKLIKLKNNIVAFEMSIGDSRIDVCRINGESYAYEIKTQYDSFERLPSQMQDYMQAFERVYVVVPESRVHAVESQIPDGCGIISYRESKNNELVFSYRKRSRKNSCNIEFCLMSLSSSDLGELLKLVSMNSKGTKEERYERLIKQQSKRSLSHKYKVYLKMKYQTNWEFLKEHFHEILPIDMQSFFSAKLNPALLYDKT